MRFPAATSGCPLEGRRAALRAPETPAGAASPAADGRTAGHPASTRPGRPSRRLSFHACKEVALDIVVFWFFFFGFWFFLEREKRGHPRTEGWSAPEDTEQ